MSKRRGALSDAWILLGAGLAVAMAGASACNGPSTIPLEGWTEPLSIWSFHPRSYFGIYGLGVAVAPDDRAFATWSYVNETEEAALVAVRAPGGGWSPPQRLDHSSPAAQTQPGLVRIVGIDPGGEALIVWEEGSLGSKALWSSRHDGQSVSVPILIARLPVETIGLVSAMSDGGDAIVAWAEGTDLRTVAYTPGQGWGEPVVVTAAMPGTDVVAKSAAMYGSEALTLWTLGTIGPGPSGDSLVSLVAIRRQGGSWLAPEVVAPLSPIDPSVTFDGRGTAVVAWAERVTLSSDHVRASVSGGSPPWIRVLDVPGTQPSLSRSSKGDVAVIFGNDVFGQGEVTVQRFDGRGFGAAETVRPPGRIQYLGSRPRLALSGGRGDVATWLESDHDFGELWTALASPSGAWGPPERMRFTPSAAACAGKGIVPDFGFTPLPRLTPSGVATVVWAEGGDCGTIGLAGSSRILPLR